MAAATGNSDNPRRRLVAIGWWQVATPHITGPAAILNGQSKDTAQDCCII